MALYAFDGTWNDSRSPERDMTVDTNVYMFVEHYHGKSFYLDGVGSRYGYVGRLWGGLTGAGHQVRVEESFSNLVERFNAGDREIDIVGYSRGAAIGRMFVHKIADHFFELRDATGAPLSEPPAVRFLGLFDTVASLGLPWTEDEGRFLPTIPEFVQRTFHAMALDEIRETFGIERCIGLRDNVCEVWFRGGHGDIGGNATFRTVTGETAANRDRSNIALNWMLSKARACQLPIRQQAAPSADALAKVTSALDKVPIGDVGTQSRRIHVGDLVHHTVDRELDAKGVSGNLLRRIDVPTRIEHEYLEQRADTPHWRPAIDAEPKAVKLNGPELIELSSRRYPFDILPARTWRTWLERWRLNSDDFASRLDEFWAPTDSDQALAWDIHVELQTRITTQALPEDEGDDKTALESVASLFDLSRQQMRMHGVGSANVATLLTRYLNSKVRPFTTKWHVPSQKNLLDLKQEQNRCEEFREDLRGLQPILAELARVLSEVAGASLASSRN